MNVYTGNIDHSGNLNIEGIEELKHIRRNFRNTSVILTVDVKDQFTPYEYFTKFVLPKCKAGFKHTGEDLTIDQTFKKLISVFDIPKYSKLSQVTSIDQLNECELFDFMDQIKQFAVKYLNTYIDDPILLKWNLNNTR